MNEKHAWRREGVLRQSEERSVCLKSFVTILTDVSRWPCQKNRAEHGRIDRKKRERREKCLSGEQCSGKHERPQRASAGPWSRAFSEMGKQKTVKKNPLNFSQHQLQNPRPTAPSLLSFLLVLPPPIIFLQCYFLLKIAPRLGALLGGSPRSRALVPRTLVII